MTGRARIALQGAVATIAASSALGSVFVGTGWLVPVAGSVLLVAAVNELLRRTPVAAALGPLVSAAAVLCYVTAADASSSAYAGFVPTGSSLQVLADTARRGFTDVRTLSTPVPTHRDLVLLAIVGVAAVELVVDLLAVTLRRAAVAGLPLLAMFVLCTSIAKGGVSWLAFILAATGYLWLLLVDSRERIGRWGRTFGADRTRGRVSWSEGDLAPSPLAALGRRIGATAVAVGVVLPLLLPGLHGGLPKHGGGGLGTGKGSNHVVTLNPIVDITAQLRSSKPIDLLTVRSSDPAPGYLRLTALDNFDGTTFYPVTLNAPQGARVGKGIAAPTVTGAAETTTVHVDGLSLHWLPLPAQVESVHGADAWLYDAGTNTVFSARETTTHRDYSAASIKVDPSPTDLEHAPPADGGQLARDLFLPTGIDVGVRTLAESITSTASSQFGKAVAIQNYLDRSPFVYDTSVKPVDSTRALADFLLVSKRGFCQQFATAMAVLARIEHIPARVAVGFTRGVRQNDGTWLVTSHDAHAWPELYFPGFGWLPFEPTPRTDGQTVKPAFTHVVPAKPQPQAPTTAPTTSSGKTDGLTGQARKQALADHGAVKLPPAPHAASGSASLWWLVLVLLAAAAVGPAVLRTVARRRRATSGDPHAAWEEMRATAIDAGVDWVDGVTPRGAGRVVAADAGLTPAGRDALNRLVRAEERARYAAAPGDTATSSLAADVQLVSRDLWATRPGLVRAAARVWPRSTLRSLTGFAAQVADGLDAVDAAGARVRRWLRRRRVAVGMSG